MKSYLLKTCLLVLALSSTVIACGGGGSSSDDSSGGGNLVINGPGGSNSDINNALEQLDQDDAAANNNDNNNDDAESNTSDDDVELAFNISDAVALFTHSEVLEEIDPISNQIQAQLIDIEGYTNLLAQQNDGSLSFAINTEYDINVLYSVLSPDKQHLYVALDNGWGWWGSATAGCVGCDYLELIIEQNCALFVVDMSDNSFVCAVEGLFPQGMDAAYEKTVGPIKPIQFDENGNMYFLATPFTITTDTFCDTSGGFDDGSSDDILTPGEEDSDGGDSENITGTCQDIDVLEEIEWAPRLYQVTSGSNGSGTAAALTSADDNVNYMLVYPNGDIALHASSDSDSQLSLRQGNTTSSLTSTGNWGVDFFALDTGNSVLFGEATANTDVTNGLRMARPNSTAISYASLDATLFVNSDETPVPRHITLGANGNLYALVETTTSSSNQVLRIYQLLPYNDTPVKELTISSDSDWWQTLNRMPLIATGGYLFYSRSHSVAGTTIDTLHAVNLTTLADTTLPLADDVLYDIYTWQLDGSTIHFIGLDQTSDIVVAGQIDTTAISQASTSAEFSAAVTYTTAAPALASDAVINGTTRLVLSAEDNSTASSPNVNTIHADSGNPYSLSIEFNTAINKASTETNVILTDASDNQVDTMRIWNENTLHLLPDLDANPEGDSLSDSNGTTPLVSGETYLLRIGNGITSEANTSLAPVADTLIAID